MERTWTNIGAEYVTDDNRTHVEHAIEKLAWRTPEGEFPAMPGLGIKAVISELRLPKVSRVAISHDLAPYGLYGIEANYKNGCARVYVVDKGSNLIPICSDFWPKEAA
jgi:hypothetical protein